MGSIVVMATIYLLITVSAKYKCQFPTVVIAYVIVHIGLVACGKFFQPDILDVGLWQVQIRPYQTCLVFGGRFGAGISPCTDASRKLCFLIHRLESIFIMCMAISAVAIVL